MNKTIYHSLVTLAAAVVLASCASHKSKDEDKSDPPSLDGTPANFDGIWNGSCSSNSYDGKDNYDGVASITIKQTDSDIEITGACYKEKPIGQYFKTNKLLIEGNDLIDQKTSAHKGQIGANALSFNSSLTSENAPGASIESTIKINLEAASKISFEYFQDGVNGSDRTRAITITGNAQK